MDAPTKEFMKTLFEAYDPEMGEFEDEYEDELDEEGEIIEEKEGEDDEDGSSCHVPQMTTADGVRYRKQWM